MKSLVIWHNFPISNIVLSLNMELQILHTRRSCIILLTLQPPFSPTIPRHPQDHPIPHQTCQTCAHVFILMYYSQRDISSTPSLPSRSVISSRTVPVTSAAALQGSRAGNRAGQHGRGAGQQHQQQPQPRALTHIFELLTYRDNQNNV